MTIGIAAFGPRAGRAVIEGLRAAEAVGTGALHGFVSLVAIGADGRLHRAEVQDGGTAALLAGAPLPDALAEATRAGLMSSGPNRPAPLSQFTPADPAVGLVTGHRFPNAPGAGGPLNLDVLALMRLGLEPGAAVARVIADNPQADAGFIALSRDGHLHAENTPYLLGFDDAGRALASAPDDSAGVAVLHNAIRPHRSLAGLVAEVALDAMQAAQGPRSSILMKAGIPLAPGHENAIEIDDSGEVRSITLLEARYLTGTWSLGLGYQAVVRRRGRPFGRSLYEPYLRAENGRITSIDGGEALNVAVNLESGP